MEFLCIYAPKLFSESETQLTKFHTTNIQNNNSEKTQGHTRTHTRTRHLIACFSLHARTHLHKSMNIAPRGQPYRSPTDCELARLSTHNCDSICELPSQEVARRKTITVHQRTCASLLSEPTRRCKHSFASSQRRVCGQKHLQEVCARCHATGHHRHGLHTRTSRDTHHQGTTRTHNEVCVQRKQQQPRSTACTEQLLLYGGPLI